MLISHFTSTFWVKRTFTRRSYLITKIFSMATCWPSIGCHWHPTFLLWSGKAPTSFLHLSTNKNTFNDQLMAKHRLPWVPNIFCHIAKPCCVIFNFKKIAAAAKMPRRGVPQCKSIHLKKKLQKICRRQIAAPLLNNCASMQNY